MNELKNVGRPDLHNFPASTEFVARYCHTSSATSPTFIININIIIVRNGLTVGRIRRLRSAASCPYPHLRISPLMRKAAYA